MFNCFNSCMCVKYCAINCDVRVTGAIVDFSIG